MIALQPFIFAFAAVFAVIASDVQVSVALWVYLVLGIFAGIVGLNSGKVVADGMGGLVAGLIVGIFMESFFRPTSPRLSPQPTIKLKFGSSNLCRF